MDAIRHFYSKKWNIEKYIRDRLRELGVESCPTSYSLVFEALKSRKDRSLSKYEIDKIIYDEVCLKFGLDKLSDYLFIKKETRSEAGYPRYKDFLTIEGASDMIIRLNISKCMQLESKRRSQIKKSLQWQSTSNPPPFCKPVLTASIYRDGSVDYQITSLAPGGWVIEFDYAGDEYCYDQFETEHPPKEGIMYAREPDFWIPIIDLYLEKDNSKDPERCVSEWVCLHEDGCKKPENGDTVLAAIITSDGYSYHVARFVGGWEIKSYFVEYGEYELNFEWEATREPDFWMPLPKFKNQSKKSEIENFIQKKFEELGITVALNVGVIDALPKRNNMIEFWGSLDEEIYSEVCNKFNLKKQPEYVPGYFLLRKKPTYYYSNSYFKSGNIAIPEAVNELLNFNLNTYVSKPND